MILSILPIKAFMDFLDLLNFLNLMNSLKFLNFLNFFNFFSIFMIFDFFSSMFYFFSIFSIFSRWIIQGHKVFSDTVNKFCFVALGILTFLGEDFAESRNPNGLGPIFGLNEFSPVDIRIVFRTGGGGLFAGAGRWGLIG